jgi:hypothetical protein
MKSIFTIAILLAGSALLDSCQDKFGEMSNTMVTVVVKDKLGNNLLDPATAGAYDPTAIRLFSVQDGGTRTELLNNLKVTSANGGSLTFQANAGPRKGNIATTAIQWRQNDEDVIESTIEKKPHSSHCSHVKANGVSKYDDQSSGTQPVIVIVK